MSEVARPVPGASAMARGSVSGLELDPQSVLGFHPEGDFQNGRVLRGDTTGRSVSHARRHRINRLINELIN